MAEERVGSKIQSLICILWQWYLGCNLKRGQYTSSLDELDNLNWPVLCVCSLIPRSLKQFHCSLIALRSIYGVFYCASNWTTVFFPPAPGWPAFQCAPAVWDGHLCQVWLADPEVWKSLGMNLPWERTHTANRLQTSITLAKFSCLCLVMAWKIATLS